MPKSYANNIFNQCKFMFVNERKSPNEISKEFGGKPSKQAITGWASKKDEKTEKTWYDLRAEQRDREYEDIAPANMAKKLLSRISEILNSEKFNEKSGDAIAKLQSTLNQITDYKHQIPVMYYMLRELGDFMKANYPELVTPKFADVIQDFKNYLRARLFDNK